MEGFPYDLRPGQQELIDAVRQATAKAGHLVVEAATGTGKTVATLAGAMASCDEDGRRIVWATRTNSQHDQVIREHGALRRAGARTGLAVPLMGRRHYCPLLKSDARFLGGSPEELGRLCRDAKRKAKQAVETGVGVQGSCPYYERLLRDGEGPVEALLEAGMTGPELASCIEGAGSCPYEALKMLLPKATLIVVPAIYVIDHRLRDALLGWLGTGPDGVHLVIDEAHHLPETAREHHTPRLSETTIARAIKEAIEFEDPPLAGVTVATSLLATLTQVLHATANEHVHNGDDGLVPPGEVEEALLQGLGATSAALGRIATELEAWGQQIRDRRQAEGRLPRSYLGAVATFLHAWMAELEGERVNIVTGGDNPALERYLLHPAVVLAWLDEFWSSIHMSGTLSPMASHISQCGLPPDTPQRIIASPFDPDQLRIAYVEGMDRRYQTLQADPTQAARQQAWATQMLGHWPGRCGLFFPSHQLLQDYLEEGFLHGCGRPLHVERPEMDSRELARLVDSFRTDARPGALLLGVLGGRLTEGIDYPGGAMEAMLLFGVPYPRPTARNQALILHFDRVSGDGWQVAVHAPVARVLRQAVGRLVRGPGDRGTAVILDERAVRFHGALPGLRPVLACQEVTDWAAREDGYQKASLFSPPHLFHRKG